MPAEALDKDTELMVRFSEGDDDAFVQLTERHRKRVLNIAQRFVGDRATADDIAQEAFVRVHQARGRYRPTSKFSTWLYQIVANLCLNEMRRRKRRPAWLWGGAEDSPQEQAPGAGPNPEESYQRGELSRAVHEALARLPEKQRMAVILNRFEELSYEEVASVLGCSVGAVDGLLSRAKATLRRELAPYVAEE